MPTRRYGTPVEAEIGGATAPVLDPGHHCSHGAAHHRAHFQPSPMGRSLSRGDPQTAKTTRTRRKTAGFPSPPSPLKASVSTAPPPQRYAVNRSLPHRTITLGSTARPSGSPLRPCKERSRPAQPDTSSPCCRRGPLPKLGAVRDPGATRSALVRMNAKAISNTTSEAPPWGAASARTASTPSNQIQ